MCKSLLLSLFFIVPILFISCKDEGKDQTHSTTKIEKSVNEITPEFTLTKDQTHNKFSSAIEPILKVKSGTIIEAFTEDASDEQFNLISKLEDLKNLSFEPIHPLTGPVYVEGASPGDVLKVTLHQIEVGDWGWNAIYPGFSFVADSIKGEYLRIYQLENFS